MLEIPFDLDIFGCWVPSTTFESNHGMWDMLDVEVFSNFDVGFILQLF